MARGRSIRRSGDPCTPVPPPRRRELRCRVPPGAQFLPCIRRGVPAGTAVTPFARVLVPRSQAEKPGIRHRSVDRSRRMPSLRLHARPWTLARTTRDSVKPRAWAKRVRASRKPVLLFRLSGSSLLRLAERALSGLLFQPPPRTTRRSQGGRAPTGDSSDQRGSNQPPLKRW